MRTNVILTIAFILGLTVVAGCEADSGDSRDRGVGGSKGGDGGSAGSSGAGSGGSNGGGGSGGSAGSSGGDCADAPDGQSCELQDIERAICIDQQCMPSLCGDGFVDSALELCDDGALNGTEESACTVSCQWICQSDAECPALECHAAGSCQENRCTPGSAEPDGTPCGQNDQVCLAGDCVESLCQDAAACNDGDACTTDSCVSGLCQHVSVGDVDGDGFECANECDDSNPDVQQLQPWYQDCDEDGYAPEGAEMRSTTFDMQCRKPVEAPAACDPLSDTWTKRPPASGDIDCDDTDFDVRAGSSWYPDCDQDGYAKAGATATSACSAPAEAPAECSAGGWTDVEPKDAAIDCDDTSAEASPDATWYADCDADGFAPDNAEAQDSCAEPTDSPSCVDGAWTSREPADTDSTDCDDVHATVNPSVVVWLESAVPGVSDPASDFDYNCDSTETRRYTAVSVAGSTCVAESSPTAASCDSHTGWAGAVAPECGAEASLVACTLVSSGTACEATLINPQKQACH